MKICTTFLSEDKFYIKFQEWNVRKTNKFSIIIFQYKTFIYKIVNIIILKKVSLKLKSFVFYFFEGGGRIKSNTFWAAGKAKISLFLNSAS